MDLRILLKDFYPLLRIKDFYSKNNDQLFVLYGVSIWASPNLDILGVMFDSNLIFEYHVLGIIFHVSQRIGILRSVKSKFVRTSVLLRCYFAFVLPIIEYCSPVWGQLLNVAFCFFERRVYTVARLCPDQGFLSLSST